ncbi:hypothetical protein [Brevibacillus choshinensis]|uniref:NERD domain-containing protein n=1 Tax=Brevibacillus choshinensis TaxID=54911 RepID=A0ABX7FIN4_BRECH|nr:hypothetical protein [Brevibacillus choshinensis]QRG65951.1 hypothetical protein JNE38_20550 [Brevibacillus choshinensis]
MEPLLHPENYTIEKCSVDILHYLRQFKIEDVFRLIGYSYIRLNHEAATSSGYKVSPKLMLNLPFMYAENACNGVNRISDYDSSFNHLVDLLEDLYYCHYNEATSGANTHHLHEDIASNVYMNFHFNFPDISIRQYLDFLYEHVDILEHYFDRVELSGDQIIKGLLILLNYERACKKSLKLRMQKRWQEIRDSHCFVDVRFDAPISLKVRTHFTTDSIRMLLNKFDIPADTFIDTMFLKVQQQQVISFEYPTNIYKKYRSYFGIKYDEAILLPRNHNILDRLFNIIEDSDLYIDKRKGDYLENRAYEIICKFFGEKNVYKNLFDENGDDQDIIVLYNGYLLSFECKATKFKEPFINKEKSETRLQRNFKPSLQKAYEQSERIAKHMNKGTAKFYNSRNREKRELVIDLTEIKIASIRSIVVTLTPYLNLGTDIHLMLKKEGVIKEPWSIDIFSLEQILLKCMYDYNIDFFIGFLENRLELYGSVFSVSGDELSHFGNYIKYRELFNQSIEGVTTHLGPGYRSFGNDFIDLDNYMVFRDYLGI